LVETTRTSKLAVIITTHYIEEAKQANCVSCCLVMGLFIYDVIIFVSIPIYELKIILHVNPSRFFMHVLDVTSE
jgi:hypothetical protein